MEAVTRTYGVARAAVFTSPYANATFMISRDASLLAFGSNSQGQLGLSDIGDRKEPAIVSFFDDGAILSVALGLWHSLFLLRDGNEGTAVFASGHNKFAQLGVELGKSAIRSLSPVRVDFFDGKRIVALAAGRYSSYCLSLEGELFAFGSNGDGELGLGSAGPPSAPQRVPMPDGMEITAVSAGARHVAALGADGCVYTFGANTVGQLGRAEDASKPMQVKLPTDTAVTSVACTAHGTFAIASPSEIYAFGGNGKGELGVGRLGDQRRPIRIAFFAEHPITWLRAGGAHAICHISIGNSSNASEQGNTPAYGIYVFGNNDEKELLFTDSEERSTPTILPRELLTPVGRGGDPLGILDAFCGLRHTLLVTSNYECYGAGAGRAFGSDELTQPLRLVATKVAMMPADYVARDLLEYSRREQSNEDISLRSTDATILVEAEVGSSVIRVNRAFLEARIGSFSERLTSPGPFTENMRTLMVDYIFSDSVDVSILEVDEADDLAQLLRNGGLFFGLAAACERYSRRISEEKEKEKPEEENDRKDSDALLVEAMDRLFKARGTGGDGIVTIESTVVKDDVHRVHRFVLIARRQYFKAMFQGGFLESTADIVRLEMPLGDAFESYIRYLYTGRLPLVGQAEAKRLMEFVDYFDEGMYEDELLREYCRRRAAQIQ